MAKHPNRGAEGSLDDPELNTFQVDLEVFQGPFDLLLQLIARRQLDITEVSLAQVTDEFLAHMRLVPDLSSATEFLVVAATLLEMKAAQLLPQETSELEIDEDLSARDLLFSRLLQYRAFKNAADVIAQQFELNSRSYPRRVPLEPHFAQLLPDLIWTVTADQLAALATAHLGDKPRPDEAQHIARPAASFTQEYAAVRNILAHTPRLTFAELVAEAKNSSVVVTRFLVILELFRQGRIAFTQEEELGPLIIEVLKADPEEDTSD